MQRSAIGYLAREIREQRLASVPGLAAEGIPFRPPERGAYVEQRRESVGRPEWRPENAINGAYLSSWKPTADDTPSSVREQKTIRARGTEASGATAQSETNPDYRGRFSQVRFSGTNNREVHYAPSEIC